jgi:hypothetical protein
MAEAPEETIAQLEDDPEDEEKIAPAPKLVPKFLTGRIPEHWKGEGNGK